MHKIIFIRRFPVTLTGFAPAEIVDQYEAFHRTLDKINDPLKIAHFLRYIVDRVDNQECQMMVTCNFWWKLMPWNWFSWWCYKTMIKTAEIWEISQMIEEIDGC